jgi:uncharacterized protein YdhG (YjbR/CyaY superfamily)
MAATKRAPKPPAAPTKRLRPAAPATKVTTIDEYLAGVAPDRRALLEALRATIRRALPEAEETVSYAMPAFRWRGKIVGGFAATSKGGSYYPFSGTTLATLAADLASFTQTKSALHFDADRPLPERLVKKLLRARMAEIEAAG